MRAMRLPILGLTAALSAYTVMAAERPATLSDQAGCEECHQTRSATLGPSWRDIAKRYTVGDDLVQRLAQRMRDGTVGIWGDIPMAPVKRTELADEELESVLRWILKGGEA